MQIKVTKLGVATYLAPNGALVEENLGQLSERVKEMRSAGPGHVVIDLRLVPFFDSSGLEFVLDLANSLEADGGSLRLAGATPLCREVLTITKLDQSIPVYDNVESAGRSFL